MTARALANSISVEEQTGGRKISFFMRKGADCLSKWVGEGERQLRLVSVVRCSIGGQKITGLNMNVVE